MVGKSVAFQSRGLDTAAEKGFKSGLFLKSSKNLENPKVPKMAGPTYRPERPKGGKDEIKGPPARRGLVGP